jgi:hypothetical protein
MYFFKHIYSKYCIQIRRADKECNYQSSLKNGRIHLLNPLTFTLNFQLHQVLVFFLKH